MCVLTTKNDVILLPLWAKFQVVVSSKSKRFAPVLKSDSLRFLVSLVVENTITLKQDDYKNTFCNGDLPSDEVIIIIPPSGDPDAKNDGFWFWSTRKTLYGLSCSPIHWYVRIRIILISIGLACNIYDPSFFIVRVRVDLYKILMIYWNRHIIASYPQTLWTWFCTLFRKWWGEAEVPTNPIMSQ